MKALFAAPSAGFWDLNAILAWFRTHGGCCHIVKRPFIKPLY
jgi:hypothetical protein